MNTLVLALRFIQGVKMSTLLLALQFILGIGLFLIVFLLRRRANIFKLDPREKQSYEQAQELVVKAVDDEQKYETKLLMMLEHIVKYSAFNPCFVFVFDKEKDYYLQCTITESELHCEVVGNENLSGSALLNKEQINKLLAIGWQVTGESGNYSMELSVEESFDPNGFVSKLMKTLNVYGFSHKSTTSMETF